MKKNVLVLGLILFSSLFPVFAGSAKVTYVKGKVEVNRNDTWIQLKVGDEVKETEMLSTGFQSEARLNYNGSVMALAALTRITLSQLRTSGKKDYVDVYVDSGSVRSKVTHVDRDPPDYKTRTAVAVASVRGTDYVTMANGDIYVLEGAVAVSKNTLGKGFKPAPAEEGVSSEEGEESESTEDEKPGDAGEGDVASGADSGAADGDADQGPANVTTPANQISQDSDAGTRVIGPSQSTSIGDDGIPKTAFETSKQGASSGNNTVRTAAEEEGKSVTQTTSGTKKATVVVDIKIVQ